jgi:4-hydroxy-3-polyprenylbenzoate decarboxylase
MRVVVAVTGASGAPYAYALLRALREADVEVDLVLSDDARKVIAAETNVTTSDFEALATRVHPNDDSAADVASGSARFAAVVVVPCSANTLAKLATGLADNLTTRVAHVALKERRSLILVPRETPLTAIHLANMLRLAETGATILPAMPGFYLRPKTVEDLVAFVVARILDHLGVAHHLGGRWKGMPG